MSVVTLEQETLAVMTELADEEISGIVGGGRGIDIDTRNQVGVNARGKNVQSNVQVGSGSAIGGGNVKIYQNSNQSIDNSRDRVYF